MPATLQHDQDNSYRLTISGILRRADLDDAQVPLLAGMEQSVNGKVRLLVVLAGFEGWDPHSNWHDLTFYVRHGDRVERIAIVGDDRWRELAMMFAAADLRKGPVEFFPFSEMNAAAAWLAK
jgi:hypothetical protein